MDREEMDDIAARAAACGLPISAYLRNLGRGYSPPSVLDSQAILGLLKVNADQGRLGGLLKLWLSTRRGEGAPHTDVQGLLDRIRTAQVRIERLLDDLEASR